MAAMTVAALGWMAPAFADQGDKRLDILFERLKVARDTDEADVLETQIWGIWAQQPGGNAEVGRLMRLGMVHMALNDYDSALKAFDRVLELAPDFAEAWNKRATVHFLKDELDASVADIERTLVLEPRHFGALSGLGMIYLQIEEMEAALKAFEAALAINPHLPVVREHVDSIKKELAGDPV